MTERRTAVDFTEEVRDLLRRYPRWFKTGQLAFLADARIKLKRVSARQRRAGEALRRLTHLTFALTTKCIIGSREPPA